MEYINYLEMAVKLQGCGVSVEYWASKNYQAGRAIKNGGGWIIKIPRPNTLENLHVAFHELGHISATGKMSCLREYEADMYAMNLFKNYGLTITVDIKTRHNWYMAYSLARALNRRLKTIPVELKPYKKYLRLIVCSRIVCKNGVQKTVAVKRYRVKRCSDTDWS